MPCYRRENRATAMLL